MLYNVSSLIKLKKTWTPQQSGIFSLFFVPPARWRLVNCVACDKRHWWHRRRWQPRLFQHSSRLDSRRWFGMDVHAKLVRKGWISLLQPLKWLRQHNNRWHSQYLGLRHRRFPQLQRQHRPRRRKLPLQLRFSASCRKILIPKTENTSVLKNK